MTFKTVRRFSKNVKGSTIVVVALALPVLLLFAAGAIDIGRTLQLRMQLQDAADAASVGLVGLGSPTYKAALAMTTDGPVPSLIAQAQAQKIFNADFTSTSAMSALTLTTNVNKSGMNVNSTVTVTAKYNTLMLGLLSPSLSQIPLSIRATSTSSIPPYIDFYLLLDNTPSMGLAATSAGMKWLHDNTPSSVSAGVAEPNCSFACHETDLPQKGKGIDYYTLAINNHIAMRIDVVRQATQQLMTTAKSTETLSNQYRMAVYDFGLSAAQIPLNNPPAYVISDLTPDLAATAANASAVDLMSVPKQNYNNDEQTNLQSVLTDMNNRILKIGNGGTPTTPQKVLFFVTDGMNDSYDCNYNDGGTSCRRIRPLDTTICQTMKNRGIQIAILYTTYIPPTSDGWSNTYVVPLVSPNDTAQKALQTCASSGLFYAVAPDQDLSAAMNALFKKVVSVERITS